MEYIQNGKKYERVVKYVIASYKTGAIKEFEGRKYKSHEHMMWFHEDGGWNTKPKPMWSSIDKEAAQIMAEILPPPSKTYDNPVVLRMSEYLEVKE